MELTEARKVISDIKNENEKKIANLFFDMGLEFAGANVKVKDAKGETIGEIDLLFMIENHLFIIEVSKDNSSGSTKKTNFFNKWAARENLRALFSQMDLSQRKVIRIFFDLTSERGEEKLSPDLERLTEPANNNMIGYADDYDYFEKQSKKIGTWAKNDLLDWLGYSDDEQKLTVPIHAIQYYIDEVPVFCFVGRVDHLLQGCYISRRRKEIEGYQRTLHERRINDISTRIVRGEGLFFPNSILINMPKGTQNIPAKSDQPIPITLNFPISFCSSRVVDGQHRLLGFSRLSKEKQRSYYLPVVALVDYDRQAEIKTFVDINSRQQRIDSNLILVLKADLRWPAHSKEAKRQIAVRVAQKLNNTFFKDRIYFGMADDHKGNKITLTTMVSAMVSNNFVEASVKDTYAKASKFLAHLQKYLPEHVREPTSYFGQNVGIRVFFRLIYVLERNLKARIVSVSEEEFFKDLNSIMTTETIVRLSHYFGAGGSYEAVTDLVGELKRKFPSKYRSLESNLTKLPRTRTA